MIDTAEVHRVHAPFVVISKSDHAYKAITLAPGDTISVRSDRTSQRSGLVEVLYDGMLLAAYLRDIEDRTECVGGETGE